jgi:hypothetical protein
VSLGRKQSITHEAFAEAFAHIERYVSREALDAKIERTVAEIRVMARAKRAAFAWSGGKDSVALELVCRLAGVSECLLGICDLEYPAFLRWATDHMPEDLETLKVPVLDLVWLAKNPDMLFPVNAEIAGKWFAKVQHRAQALYFEKRKLDILILGRRRADGNMVGRNGANVYTSKGIVRYSPIADWSHEDVLACVKYYRLPLETSTDSEVIARLLDLWDNPKLVIQEIDDGSPFAFLASDGQTLIACAAGQPLWSLETGGAVYLSSRRFSGAERLEGVKQWA